VIPVKDERRKHEITKKTKNGNHGEHGKNGTEVASSAPLRDAQTSSDTQT